MFTSCYLAVSFTYDLLGNFLNLKTLLPNFKGEKCSEKYLENKYKKEKHNFRKKSKNKRNSSHTCMMFA